MMCNEGINDCLKKSGIYILDGKKTICNECQTIFHDKHEQWSHSLHYHVIITFEQAYKKAVKKYHPDQFYNQREKAKAQEQMKKVNSAYDNLMKS